MPILFSDESPDDSYENQGFKDRNTNSNFIDDISSLLDSSPSYNSDISYDSKKNKQKYRYRSRNAGSSSTRRGLKQVQIPKIIMQTWKNQDIPNKWKPSTKSIKRYMPEWKHIIMTDEDNRKFIKKHFPDFLHYYDKFPYNIQRADAIRACWLYVYGGIYMDLDIEILKPLDSLFYQKHGIYLVNSGNFSSYTTNSFMASQPRNPIWLEYIEQMKKSPNKWVMGKHFTVMTTTGPMALTNVLKNTHNLYTLLPSKLLMPCSVCDDRCDVNDSYLRPLEGQSWNAWDSKFFNFFLCHWKKVIILVIVLIILIIIILMIVYIAQADNTHYK